MKCLEKAVITECNGYNHKELSREYGLSVRHIEKIVQKAKELAV